jgi:Immunity protein 42
MSPSTIGLRTQFAIDFEVLPEPAAGGAWLFGKCCYWIGGDMVGNYDLGTSLRDVLGLLPYIVGDNGSRNEPRLFDLATDQTYDLLKKLLCSDEIQQNDPRYVETAARFLIMPRVDVFDNYLVFCVGCGESARLIYKHREWPGPREVRASLNLVESTIRSFYDELNLLYDAAVAIENDSDGTRYHR